jgi:hypothetical protein
MDRHTIAGTGQFVESKDDEFMENNCVDDPVRLCDFQLLEHRIMKTVDSVYQVKQTCFFLSNYLVSILLLHKFEFHYNHRTSFI